MYIRKLKSRNGHLQIQVVQKDGRQNKVVKHLGTARSELEVNELVNLAKQFIENQRIKSGKLSLFDNRYSTSEMAEILSNPERLRKPRKVCLADPAKAAPRAVFE